MGVAGGARGGTGRTRRVAACHRALPTHSQGAGTAFLSHHGVMVESTQLHWSGQKKGAMDSTCSSTATSGGVQPKACELLGPTRSSRHTMSTNVSSEKLESGSLMPPRNITDSVRYLFRGPLRGVGARRGVRGLGVRPVPTHTLVASPGRPRNWGRALMGRVISCSQAARASSGRAARRRRLMAVFL